MRLAGHGVRRRRAQQLTTPELGPLLEQYATALAPIYMQGLPDPLSEPEDIAAAVAWSASDEARHVTGSQLPVDLGILTR